MADGYAKRIRGEYSIAIKAMLALSRLIMGEFEVDSGYDSKCETTNAFARLTVALRCALSEEIPFCKAN